MTGSRFLHLSFWNALLSANHIISLCHSPIHFTLCRFVHFLKFSNYPFLAMNSAFLLTLRPCIMIYNYNAFYLTTLWTSSSSKDHFHLFITGIMISYITNSFTWLNTDLSSSSDLVFLFIDKMNGQNVYIIKASDCSNSHFPAKFINMSIFSTDIIFLFL